MSELARMRVDNVGSLLRPEPLKAAFAAHEVGDIGDEDLRSVQDRAIEGVIRRQEESGMPVLTDGEFRRRHFNESFAEVAGWGDGLAPVQMSQPAEAAAGPGVPAGERLTTIHTQVSERLRLVRNRPLVEFEFAQGLTDTPVKATLLNPDGIAQRFDAGGSSQEIYPDVESFLADVVAVEREIVAGLVAAGCRYVQIDAPRYSAYVDAQSRAELEARGRDLDRSLELAVQAENDLIAGFPGVTFGLHICRGNRQSQWHFEGGYARIAEQLGELRHDRLLLEYDSDRAGGFEPLRYLTGDTLVVLGLITTKVGELESKEELKRRIDEAAQHMPLERLALSTQCGFATVLEGNLLTEDDQWRKLELMLSVAEDVWG